MIQDIFPRHLDNQYKNVTINEEDVILIFQGSTVLGKQVGDEVIYPLYKELCETGKNENYEFTYLLSLTDAKGNEAKGNEAERNETAEKEVSKKDAAAGDVRFFLATEKDKLQKGTFVGEMADASAHNEIEAVLPGYEFIGVNIFRKAKPKTTAFAAITGYHLYGWYRDNKFCGRCGHIMVHSEKERMVQCPVCKNMVFPKICPAVIVGVTHGDKILLTKYAGRAYKNYALVAGFTEIGETVEETVIREVMEEVGLKVKNLQYYKSQPWALSGSLLYGFYCELDGDDETIRLDENELAVGEWVHADDIDIELDDISLTNEMICKFKSEHKSK